MAASDGHNPDGGMKRVLIASMLGTTPDDHDHDTPGAETVSVRAGHEPDKFGVRSILAVPALLTLLVIAVFGIVTVIFSTLYSGGFRAPSPGGVNPKGLDLNTVASADGTARVDRDISERFARIGSTKPTDIKGLPGTAVAQPRLEYLKQTAPETNDDPAFVRSKRPVDTATNTYEIRPEDLRPENYIDPVTREKVLATYGWVDPAKKVARIPIAEAIKLAAEGKLDRLKVRKAPVVNTSVHTPTLSNGGVGQHPNVSPGTGRPTAEHKHDDKPHATPEKH